MVAGCHDCILEIKTDPMQYFEKSYRWKVGGNIDVKYYHNVMNKSKTGTSTSFWFKIPSITFWDQVSVRIRMYCSLLLTSLLPNPFFLFNQNSNNLPSLLAHLQPNVGGRRDELFFKFSPPSQLSSTQNFDAC